MSSVSANTVWWVWWFYFPLYRGFITVLQAFIWFISLKNPQTCCRTLSVTTDIDWYTSMVVQTQGHKGWLFSVLPCSVPVHNTWLSPWGSFFPQRHCILLCHDPIFEAWWGAWVLQVSSRYFRILACVSCHLRPQVTGQLCLSTVVWLSPRLR